MSKAVKVNKVINTTRNMYLGKYSFSLQAIRLTCPAEPILRPTANSFTTVASRPRPRATMYAPQGLSPDGVHRRLARVQLLLERFPVYPRVGPSRFLELGSEGYMGILAHPT